MYNNRTNKSGLPAQRRITALSTQKRSGEEPPLLKRIINSSLIGIGVIALSGLLLLLTVCFIALSSSDPLHLIAPLSMLALFPSAFLGGFVCSKRVEGSPLACGAVTAAMWTVVSLILSLCLFNTPSADYELWQSIILHLSSILFCIFGAFAGKYKPRRNPRKQRRFGR